MNQSRRQVLVGGAALMSTGWAALAQAQPSAANYPGSPVKIVVGFSAGGPTDLAARLIAAKLQTAFGQSFIVDNKPGAGSNLASEIVAKAAPDGYTLLMAAAPLAINNHLYKDLKLDALRSFEPISHVMSAPCILAVRPESYKTMAELVAAAKKEPGKLSFSSSGAGGSQHLAGELFQQKAGIQLIHVPYKGAAPALADLLGGQVSMGFMTSLSSVPYFTERQAARAGGVFDPAPAATARRADHGRSRLPGRRDQFLERPAGAGEDPARDRRQAAARGRQGPGRRPMSTRS